MFMKTNTNKENNIIIIQQNINFLLLIKRKFLKNKFTMNNIIGKLYKNNLIDA